MLFLFNALRLTLKHYFKIMPYLFLGFILYFLINTIPFIGTVLALPVLVGMAYTTTYVALSEQPLKSAPLFIGYEEGFLGKNILYLLVQQLLTYGITFVVGGRLFLHLLREIDFESLQGPPLYWVMLLFTVIFLPAFIFSMILAMVPYLLADPKFNQTVQNPLITSFKMLKGHYIRLLAYRIPFILWYLWLIGGSVFTGIWLIVNTMLEPTGGGIFVVLWLLSGPLHVLLIMPWYRMVHTLLFIELRRNIS